MSSEKIPESELAHFIVTVRLLASKEHGSRREYERVMRKIKNMANKLFRDYVGYTPEGAYRIKPKGERCFQEAVEELGGADATLQRHAQENPLLRQILRKDEPPTPTERDPDPPLHLVQRRKGTQDPAAEWAEDFDPEAPVRSRRLVRTPELVDLDRFLEDADPSELELEIVRAESED